MDEQTSKKSLLTILGVIALIVIAALAYFAFGNKNKNNQTKQQGSTKNEAKNAAEEHGITVKTVDSTKLPEKFPSDIPLEANAKIVLNQNANIKDGRFNASRIFESQKSMDENYKIYLNYMENNGWDVTKKLDQPTIKALSAKKGNALLQVDVSQNTVTKVITVDIEYTETPNAK